MNIYNNINYVRQNLPAQCTLIAVSKTQPLERIREAYEAGHRVFGENKVQELVTKYEALPRDIQWHMIGHLQTNKVRYIVPFVHLIHGVDTEKLLAEINRQGAKIQRKVPCLLQVFIAREETKFGFSPDEILALIPAMEKYPNVRIMGLMGMATFTGDHAQIQREFAGLKALFDNIKSGELPPNVEMKELSMGMSGDYALAVAEGSTMVRIGTAIFGNRNLSQP